MAQFFYRWQVLYGAMDVIEVKRLKELHRA
jgi:hypothetical protein